jgi:hypothetical protein
MSNAATKPAMKRFEPDSGWSDAVTPLMLINEHHLPNNNNKITTQSEALSADALSNLGDSIQDVFSSLKISDTRLESWSDVDLAIRSIGVKLKEKKLLENRLVELKLEIEEASTAAALLVNDAYKREMENHATSKLRLEIAEMLNQKLANALKN